MVDAEMTDTRGHGLTAALVAVVAAIVFLQYWDGPLSRDRALLLYAGQQMALGVPPIVSLFDHNSVLSPLFAGTTLIVSGWLGADDVLAVRLAFLLVSGLVAAAVYLLGAELFRSRSVGLLSSLVFVGFDCFARDAASGPRTKTPMLLCAVLSLLFIAKRRWFLGGLCGSLAFLAWQPTGAYAALAVCLAFAQSSAGRERVRNVARAATGLLLPLIAVAAYYILKGGLGDLLDGLIWFNIVHLERPPEPLFMHLAMPIGAIYRGYTILALVFPIGFLAMVVLAAWRIRLNGGSLVQFARRDRFAGLLISLPLPIIWSLIDFQACSDLYIFLPYFAIGFAWLVHESLNLFDRVPGAAGIRKPALMVLCTMLPVYFGGYYYYQRAQVPVGLEEQRDMAKQIESEVGPDGVLVSIGAPEVLVLLRRTNPSRYGFLASGVGNHIEANVPGGFEAWLAGLESYDPAMIIVGQTSGRYKERLLQRLRERFDERALGSWMLFVKRKPAGNGEAT